ncbi:hypothetical protein L21TH_2472 [Caldisalinibacter kiritimatiensis]|uniref:YkoP-like domain-containing protein n=2 Tax=Caldisalinibacter kiritimatiensis TaxID=1304284 RepID=R1AQR3_9FIRM|nr:hypothetical protein L21TH_2472 [Caldisalinibacter kiritimatiensis]
MYVVTQKYNGKDIQLSDGTMVTKGDFVAEFHIDNLKMNQVKNDLKSIFRYLDEELIALAEAAITHEEFKNIKAYYGRTVLHPIAKKRDFTIIDVENKKFFLKFWDNLLKLVFQSSNSKGTKKFRDPKECWISKEQLGRFLSKKGDYNEKENN